MMIRTMKRRNVIGTALATAAGFTLFGSANGQTSPSAQNYITPEVLQKKDVYTFLVLGLDTRPDESELNTDVMMVSRVDLNQKTVRTMSIPRDLYVEIPGYGHNKINQAFKSAASNGSSMWMEGMAATRAVIENSFGISIDAGLSLRFEGAMEIVDLFGGVTFENPYELSVGVKEPYPAGTLHINGTQALELMRARKQDMDDGRVMRQQLILTALLNETQDPANIANLPELVILGRKYVATDIPLNIQLQLLAAAPSIPPENLIWGSMTHLLWGGTLDSGMWVYQGDWDVLPGYMQGFLNGDVD